MNQPVEDESIMAQTVPSLEKVSEHFSVSLYTVTTKWRDQGGCSALESAPYDLDAVAKWLSEDADGDSKTISELERKKLEEEVKQLEKGNRPFSRDAAFWLAAAALGLTVSREVREWLKAGGDPLQKKPQDPIRRRNQRNLPRTGNAKIYVGNLAFSVTSDDLEQVFSRYGTVISATVIIDRETGRSRGFGFVEMADGAEEAILSLNGNEIQGTPLTKNEARPRTEGRPKRRW